MDNNRNQATLLASLRGCRVPLKNNGIIYSVISFEIIWGFRSLKHNWDNLMVYPVSRWFPLVQKEDVLSGHVGDPVTHSYIAYAAPGWFVSLFQKTLIMFGKWWWRILTFYLIIIKQQMSTKSTLLQKMSNFDHASWKWNYCAQHW